MHCGQSLLRQLSPSKVCPSLPLRPRGPGPFPAELAPGWWQQVCQRAEPGRDLNSWEQRQKQPLGQSCCLG